MTMKLRAAVADAAPVDPPVAVGESCHRGLSFSRESIAEFARLTGDTNPLHEDLHAAARSHHGRIIASGQQTTSQMIGLAATYFSQGHGTDEPATREVLCLNFNFAFMSPVFADVPVDLSWRIASVDWHATLQGWLAHVDGRAVSLGHPCVVARGTLLIKPAAARA
jgi:acyl dehydratase